jgi:hypothetical protein
MSDRIFRGISIKAGVRHGVCSSGLLSAGPSIALRIKGIGGPPRERNSSWKGFQDLRPPRDFVQSARSLMIISLPSVERTILLAAW